MADIFAEDIAAARELIDLYGTAVQWVKAPAAEEGDAPGYSTAGEALPPIPCKIAFFRPKDVGYGGEAFAALMKGTEVQAGEEIGLLAGGLSFDPSDQDTIMRGGDELAIKWIDRIAPNGTPVLFFVKVAS